MRLPRLLSQNAWLRRGVLMLVDLALCTASFFLALLLRYESALTISIVQAQLRALIHVLIIYGAVFFAGGMYRVLWRMAGVGEMLRMMRLGVIAALLTALDKLLLRIPVSYSVLVITAVSTLLLMALVRFGWRVWHGRTSNHVQEVATNGALDEKVLVVGAGEGGAYVISSYLFNRRMKPSDILLVDDDPYKQKLQIKGVRVIGTIDDVPELIRKYRVVEIILAIPSMVGARYNEVLQMLSATKCRVKVLSDPKLIEGSTPLERIHLREVNAVDLLSREEVHLDTEAVRGHLSGKTVLVTGGGGSIGAELCRQIMRFAPKLLLVFDVYENCAYTLYMELKRLYGADCPVRVLIGSVQDARRLEELFEAYRPEVIFHAAAHKHVPLMEFSIAEAVQNNVFGTKNVLDVASRFGSEHFVLLSTDKAVNPTSVMGATKRVCEMLVRLYAMRGEMRCVAVRFGNVLGSHGSVIPIFESQIRAGGPVTVTHRDITRYFMTIPEAAQLVLQAGAMAESGAIYVLDMGEQVRIWELAERVIRFFGFVPGEDIQIEETGLRPGEKLYEELMTEEEIRVMTRTEHEKITVAPPFAVNRQEFEQKLAKLARAAEVDNDEARLALADIVPGYEASCADGAGQAAG